MIQPILYTLSSDNMDKRLSHIIRAVVFIASSLLMIMVVSSAMKGQPDPSSSWYGFLRQPPNSINHLIIGNSHANCTLAPMQIWQDTGITSWVLSSGGTNSRQKLAFFEEALKTQKPQLVAVEMFSLSMERTQDFGRNKSAYRHMPNGFGKYLAVVATSKEATQVPVIIFPLLENHTKWQTFSRDSVIQTQSSREATITGGANILVREPREIEPWNQNESKPSDYDVINENIEYLKRIAKRCRDESIPLILWLAPVQSVDMRLHYKYAQQRILAQYPEVRFVNMNDSIGEIGLTDKDFRDPGHLYLWGMKKATAWWCDNVLGDYDYAEQNESTIAWWNHNANVWNDSTQTMEPQ